MAASKDKRTRRLRALRRKELRIARRAMRRRRKALRHGDKREAYNALRVARRHRREAQQYLQDIRARRKSLRYRLKFKPKNGLAYFEGRQVAEWIAPVLAQARATGLWHGGLTSGYRSTAYQWIIYYVKRIRPAARPGTSNHERKGPYPNGAIDTNDPWGLRNALQRIGKYGVGPGKLIGFQVRNDPWHMSARGN